MLLEMLLEMSQEMKIHGSACSMAAGSQGVPSTSSFSPSGLVWQRDEFSISTAGRAAALLAPAPLMAARSPSALSSTNASAG